MPEEKRVSFFNPEKHDEQESLDASKIDLKRSFDESNITNSEESLFIL